MKLRALIVDDEPIARRRLVRLLEPHASWVSVVAEASDAVEAREAVDAHAPDVLFLDVEMPGEDGLQLARGLSVQPQIVFVTAHDRFALESFRENTIDYLLKPVCAEDVARAVGKLRSRLAPLRPDARPHSESERRLVPLEHILVTEGETLRPVPVGAVTHFESRDKYTMVHTTSGTHEIQVALSVLETKLPPGRFVRIHRSHLVNVDFIRELTRLGPRQLQIILSVPTRTELLVSRRHVQEVMKRLGCID